MRKQKWRICILTLLALFLGINASAENHEIQQAESWNITGKVIDEEREPLTGASVVVKNKNTGTVTGADGSFSVRVSKNDVLLVSYVGFKKEEITITGQQTLTIILKNEAWLDEVTVTALGIKREKKALGYAIGEIKGEELEKAKEINVINALAGKVPGLIISQTAGGPAGSSRVIIRGSTELTGNNQPLYVVDGVPLDNTNLGSSDTWGGYDLGDGISAVNPDDIETISVLKGPAASALYGSRASHGVILITTKKAQSGKRIGIEWNSTMTAEQQLTKYDDVQTVYGQGTNGLIYGGDQDRFSSNSSWGPKFDPGLSLGYFDGTFRPYVFVRDNIDGFFRTGRTATNSLIFNSVRENTGLRLTYTNMLNQDIVPNSGMNRNSINVRANTVFARNLEMDVKVSYVKENVNNRPALAGHRANPGTNLIKLATSFDQAWLKNNYKTIDGDYRDWNAANQYNINPYWIINEMKNNSDKDQIMASAALKYTFNNQFKMQLSGGGEMNLFDFAEYAPPTTPGWEIGFLQKTRHKAHTYNTELLFTYNDRKGDFTFGGNIGGNIFYTGREINITTAKDMQMRETIALQSFLSKEIAEDSYRKQINSVFAMANISYKDFLFVDATVRGDHSSTLFTGYNKYLYPSLSGSFLFSELLKLNKKIWSYGKLRASIAEVGSDTEPYQLNLVYAISDKTYEGYSLAYIYNNTIPNKRLKPTRTQSAELGTDWSFFENRLGIDFTYYTQRSRDQIMHLNTSIATGYGDAIINAGEIENSGFEIALNTQPVKAKDFAWNLNINFSRNRNKVVKLSGDIKNFQLEAAGWMGVQIAAVEGENYGAIMGRDFVRNEAGEMLINPSSGYPLVSEGLEVLGNAAWDWTGGLTNSLKYKQFVLSCIIDVKMGADIYSLTSAIMHENGKSTHTLEGRDEWYRSEEQRMAQGLLPSKWTPTGGYVAKGVIESEDINGNKVYTENTMRIDPQQYWAFVAQNIATPFIRDNSYVKIRELSLSYDFPKKRIGKFAESIVLSFVARNPFILYKNVTNIDPDSNYNNGSGMGLEYGSLPSRRSIGFNINMKF